MTQTPHKTWQEYEAGLDYNRRIGLYETVRKNERFYRGEQWSGNSELPRPVFNFVRRIVNHLVGAVLPADLSIRYSDERMPFLKNSAHKKAVGRGITLLERNAAYRWKQNHMSELMSRALLDAALTGDGVFYCWWDDRKSDGQSFLGDIRTDTVSTTDLFVADVQRDDLQSQDYVILSGRATVDALRREALAAGCSEREITKIVGDSGEFPSDTDLPTALDPASAAKATYLIKFFRENGEVIFEKSTRDCVIRRVHTGLTLYPVAYFNWYPTKKSFHGSAPATDLIPNQTYINTAYAMVMKHMNDTAFSKVIYDKSRIPEWSNEIGEAIAAVGGGSVSDAVSVVGVGEMQDGYLELIDSVVQNTKAMMGVTDASLGDEKANNTSAILALQEATSLSLNGVVSRLCRAIEELAEIWADMLCAYCPPERLLTFEDHDELFADHADYGMLRQELIRAAVQADRADRFTPSATVATLDRLLDSGHISLEQYLKYLPTGALRGRDLLLHEISLKGSTKHE